MYLGTFGLHEEPFRLAPDARFWFGSRTHKRAMAYLTYGLAQAEGFIALTGAIGAGKSTMIEHLLATIDRARRNVVLIASTQIEGEELLGQIAERFGIARPSGKGELGDAIEAHLRAEFRAGKHNLLIVDEAQNLPHSALEELRMLSNLTDAGRSVLQIVLSGQPEFRDRLQRPELEQLRQRVIASHHLEPMGADEVEPYVLHRLAKAGWSGPRLFNEEACAALYHASGGIPRRINLLAHRLLIAAEMSEVHAISAADVEAAVAEMEEEQGEVQQQVGLLPLKASAASFEPAFVADDGLNGRLAQIERQLVQQDEALRRVLNLLIDWVEADTSDAMRTEAA
jgi:general secretion pathway protein A